MEYYCQHCNRFTVGSAYRVRSEEFGRVMLDIVVCYECSLDARRLGLHADKIELHKRDCESQSDVQASESRV
jgi:RNase P subunit RPR2